MHLLSVDSSRINAIVLKDFCDLSFALLGGRLQQRDGETPNSLDSFATNHSFLFHLQGEPVACMHACMLFQKFTFRA